VSPDPKERIMDHREPTPFTRALAQVEAFSEKNVAVLPENPGKEMLAYVASITGEDAAKLGRLYEVFVAAARLDKFQQPVPSGMTGFAEE